MKIERAKYINQLLNLKDNGRVKVITGIRRCGKSFLLKELYKQKLIELGIEENHIIYISLEDFEYVNLLNPLELDLYIKKMIIDDSKYYVMIDEIQNVYDIIHPMFTNGRIVKAKKSDSEKIGFTQVALGLMNKDNIDLYITGSNSKFLSTDIITEFRDRGDEINVLPLSFREFVNVFGNDYEKAYDEYSAYGGMPRVLMCKNIEEKIKYLNNLYDMTYSKDVMERNSYKNTMELNILTQIIASNIGSLTSPSTIADTFNSVEKLNIGRQSVYNYLRALEEAFLISKVNRVDIRGKKHIGATYKYYFKDLGIRNSRVDFLHKDSGHVMENIIYNELIYRGFNVEVGMIEAFTKNKDGVTIRNKYETDFVATKGGKVYYIQCAYNLYDEEKILQESKSLLLIKDSFKKIIITRQSKSRQYNEHGVLILGVIDFLLNEDCLAE